MGIRRKGRLRSEDLRLAHFSTWRSLKYMTTSSVPRVRVIWKVNLGPGSGTKVNETDLDCEEKR